MFERQSYRFIRPSDSVSSSSLVYFVFQEARSKSTFSKWMNFHSRIGEKKIIVIKKNLSSILMMICCHNEHSV